MLLDIEDGPARFFMEEVASLADCCTTSEELPMGVCQYWAGLKGSILVIHYWKRADSHRKQLQSATKLEIDLCDPLTTPSLVAAWIKLQNATGAWNG